MTIGPRAQCDACTHLHPVRLDQPWTCDAFPAGIPEAILDDEVDHRQPVDGDRGIQFEAKAGDEFPAYAFL
ncbi:MAG TPA: hypothetical protein VF223_04800 [Trebonia sp.]